MKVTIALTMLAGAAATDCSPGYTHKKILTNLKCKSDVTTATLNGDENCNAACCDPDKKTCGGLFTACTDAKTYAAKDGTDATQAEKDAWAGQAATAKTVQTDCCIKKSTCGTASFTCDSKAGFMKNVNDAVWQKTECQGGTDASCVKDCCTLKETATCEVVDAGKLKTNGACQVPANGGNAGLISGFLACGGNEACELAWSKTKADAGAAAKQIQSCCVVQPKCSGLKSSFTCPVGKKLNAADADTLAATFENKCCVTDTSVCKGVIATCAAGLYQDDALGARAVTAATKDKACCAPKAKCPNYACPSGSKPKKNAATISCPKGLSSCNENLCCDKDLTTCGGNNPTVPISCASGFYDERSFWKTQTDVDNAAKTGITIKATPQAVKDAWNLKNTSAATKTVECCTPVANCTNITAAVAAGITTTPAAVVTTTPAPPALKFSEHKVATEKSSGGSNMVWLGAGAFIGMGVLMVVQHVRSSKSHRTISSDDVSLE